MANKTKARKGNITLITAAISVLIVGVVALVTDVGYVYYEHAKLQTATNAAWKAGYDKLSELRKTNPRLSDNNIEEIKLHMKEVMKANGYENLSEEEIQILLVNNQTDLKIDTKDKVDLFFMKIFDVDKSDVSAFREGIADGAKLMPVAIPHGEVHDLSWKTYDWVPFTGEEGFASGTEYIIKLGEQENDDPLGDEKYMIYIPTGLVKDQVNDARLLAYGAAFWALQIDERDKDSLTPAYWLLSDNGGGFLTRYSRAYEERIKADYPGVDYFTYDAQQIIELLAKVGVIIPSKDQINDYLTGIAHGDPKYSTSRILPLTWRPQIAVYSSQADFDPVEKILRTAKIPYGNYALPKTDSNPQGWDRTTPYDASKNTKIFDLEILDGALNKYDWIHLHHEDFTGLTINDGSNYNEGKFPTNCQNLRPGCYQNIPLGKTASSVNSQEEANQILYNLGCESCRNYMNVVATTTKIVEETILVPDGKEYEQVFNKKKNKWEVKEVQKYRSEKVIKYTYISEFQNWTTNPINIFLSCKREGAQRCGKCGYFNPNDLSGQTNFSGCKFYNYLKNLGYEDDIFTSYPPKFYDANIGDMGLTCIDWFSTASAYQKMKWDVAKKVKEHIMRGGFMYTQCFAAETLDLALHQGAYYECKDVNEAYKACLVFTDFRYKQLPKKGGYSSIYSSTNGEAIIQEDFKLSPLCQTVGKPSSGAGATSSFNKSIVKPSVNKMAKLGDGSWQYLGGKLKNELGEEKGQFSLMGGHSANNTAAKRYVLDNVMYGSTSDKETSIGTHLAGRTKYQYGCIDPDNDGNKTAADYLDRLKFGYNSPINFADIISTDNRKYTKESQEATDLITGKEVLDSYTPNQIVIVPIVGTPDTVKEYQNGIQRPNDQPVPQDEVTIYDIKVGDINNGAADSDNLDMKYKPQEVGINNLKNSVQVIGFAKFRIMSPDEYTRSEEIGEPLAGQIRGEFLEYVVDPREFKSLLDEYNSYL